MGRVEGSGPWQEAQKEQVGVHVEKRAVRHSLGDVSRQIKNRD